MLFLLTFCHLSFHANIFLSISDREVITHMLLIIISHFHFQIFFVGEFQGKFSRVGTKMGILKAHLGFNNASSQYVVGLLSVIVQYPAKVILTKKEKIYINYYALFSLQASPRRGFSTDSGIGWISLYLCPFFQVIPVYLCLLYYFNLNMLVYWF